MSEQREPLFIDVGNTNVHWLWNGQYGQLSSQQTPLVLPERLRALLASVDDIVFVSVRRSQVLDELMSIAPAARWHLANIFPSAMLSSDYDVQRLGADRWVGMLGAVALGFARDNQPVCVIDAGTAVTFDDLRGQHHAGGWIMPGYRVWFESLLKQTDMALLNVGSPTLALGLNTNQAVANSWVNAVCAMIATRKNEVPGLRVVLTGGDAVRLLPWIPDAVHIPDLIFQGLKYWYQHCKATI